MARIVVLFLILFADVWTPLSAEVPHLLIGSWEFTSMIYQGNQMPRPNPDLHLYFEFFEGGLDRVYWRRDNDVGFCERKAHYEVNGDQLKQLIVWVNPKNAFNCAQDTDMQMGRESVNVIRIHPERFELDLNLGDEILTYVFTPAEVIESQQTR